MLSANPHYRFGDFVVDTDQKVLLRQDKALPLTPKLFETLLILVENSGRIVQKEQFMERLWPHTYVEEANLTSNIQQLRKSLGDNARQPHTLKPSRNGAIALSRTCNEWRRLTTVSILRPPVRTLQFPPRLLLTNDRHGKGLLHSPQQPCSSSLVDSLFGDSQKPQARISETSWQTCR